MDDVERLVDVAVVEEVVYVDVISETSQRRRNKLSYTLTYIYWAHSMGP